VSIRLRCCLLLLLLGTFSLAHDGNSFANLTINAFGDEVLDISTGISTLTDGGRVTDRASGVELESEHITYLAGSFIETGMAHLTGPFGSVTGGSVRVDIPEGEVHAHGELEFLGPNLQVLGTELAYYVDRGVIVLTGGVDAPLPGFSAASLFYDTASGTVLLVGPYSFDDGLISLSSSQPGAYLELLGAQADPDGEGPARFQVSSEPSQATLDAFAALLD